MTFLHFLPFPSSLQFSVGAGLPCGDKTKHFRNSNRSLRKDLNGRLGLRWAEEQVSAKWVPLLLDLRDTAKEMSQRDPFWVSFPKG